VRLFSALLPPAVVRRSLAAELARVGARLADGDLRWIPAGRWHVTLGFFGDCDDAGHRALWLRERLAEQAAVDVRPAGAGTFPGVLWAGVEGAGLADLAVAAGEGFHHVPFRAHLTLARSRSPAVLASWSRGLAGYRGPEWHVGEVVLMRSDAGSAGVRHRVVERFPLGGRAADTTH
jgi:2'-5' RNA ligase